VALQEEQVIAAKPTDDPESYDGYLRGLAYSLRTGQTPANVLGAQKYLREAVRFDPKFALSWVQLSYVNARGYLTQALQPTFALREEARQAAETLLPSPLKGARPVPSRAAGKNPTSVDWVREDSRKKVGHENIKLRFR
jgi:hypothetical protein